MLWDNAEHYGHHLARSLNDTISMCSVHIVAIYKAVDTSSVHLLLLVINSNRIGAASVNTSEISFPEEEDLVNYTSDLHESFSQDSYC